LTRGALAEMRTLLLELRPVALKDAELGDLLKQLGESINGRARIPSRSISRDIATLLRKLKLPFTGLPRNP